MTDPDEAVPVEQLSFTEASRELDSIVNFFEQREVDVDVLVGRLERATALDRRARPAPAPDPGPGRGAGAPARRARRQRGRHDGGEVTMTDGTDAPKRQRRRTTVCISASCSPAATSRRAT